MDKLAETTWISLGGHVWSYRPKALGPESYGIEFWDLGGETPRVFMLADEPTWANYASACLYRDILVADACDRLVAFYRPGRSRGAGLTAELAQGQEKPIFEYEREDAHAA